MGQCSHIIVDNCCGNGYCERGESSICADDCGPFSLDTPDIEMYYNGLYGFVFELNALNTIQISGLSFYADGSGTATVYTVAQSYSGIETDSSSWTQIFSGSVTGGEKLVTCFSQEEGAILNVSTSLFRWILS